MFNDHTDRVPSWIPSHSPYDYDTRVGQASGNVNNIGEDTVFFPPGPLLHDMAAVGHNFSPLPPPPGPMLNSSSLPTPWGQNVQQRQYDPQGLAFLQHMELLPMAMPINEGLFVPGQALAPIYTAPVLPLPDPPMPTHSNQHMYSLPPSNGPLPLVPTASHRGHMFFDEFDARGNSPAVPPANGSMTSESGPIIQFNEAAHAQYPQHLEDQSSSHASFEYSLSSFNGHSPSSEGLQPPTYELDSPSLSAPMSMMDADTSSPARESFLALLELQEPSDSDILLAQSSVDTTFATSKNEKQGPSAGHYATQLGGEIHPASPSFYRHGGIELPSEVQQYPSAPIGDHTPEAGRAGESLAPDNSIKDLPHHQPVAGEASSCPDLQNGESDTPTQFPFDQASTASESTSSELSSESLEERTPRREQIPHQSQLTIHRFLHWLALHANFTPKKILGDDFILEEALVGCGGPNNTWIAVQARSRYAGQHPAMPPLPTLPQPQTEVTDPSPREKQRKGTGKKQASSTSGRKKAKSASKRAAKRQPQRSREYKQPYRLRHVPVDPSIPKPKDCYRHCTGRPTIRPWLDVEDVGSAVHHIDIDEEGDEDEMEW